MLSNNVYAACTICILFLVLAVNSDQILRSYTLLLQPPFSYTLAMTMDSLVISKVKLTDDLYLAGKKKTASVVLEVTRKN